MCRPENNKTTTATTAMPNQRLLLVSKESYHGHEKEIPSTKSMIVTGSFFIVLLCFIEWTLQQLFISMKVRHD
jgi:hypothetical protein